MNHFPGRSPLSTRSRSAHHARAHFPNTLRLLSCLVLSLLLNDLALGWGSTAHRIINRSAVLHLPPAMQQLASQQAYLADHASDADYRKSTDPSEDPKHYLDLEAYPASVQLPRDLNVLAQQYGWTVVNTNGTLPWATVQALDSLIAQARRGDWAKAYQTAADIGHYVGDACQPLHCTVNYDGRQTGNDGIHSRYETGLVNQYQSLLTVSSGTPDPVTDPYQYMLDRIMRSNALVDSILKGDNAAKLASGWTGAGQAPQSYYVALWEKTGAMTVQLIREATIATASLWEYAWMQAGLMNPLTVARAPSIPAAPVLMPNYPNPFNSSTIIPFEVAASGHARLTVHTVLGQEVAVLFDDVVTAGTVYRVPLEASRLATGVYIYRLQSGGWADARRLTLIR